jgi:hypothetical protein
VRLDPTILADLALAFTPKAYVRMMPMVHAATPLGAGYGASRFASPTGAYTVIYLAQDLTTSVAETIVRDRFQGRFRAGRQRRLMLSEVGLWGATEVSATRPLTLIDLRTEGLLRLGVSTEAARGKAQGQGRLLSQAIHNQTDADGLLYLSRLTGRSCVCIYERALPGPLVAAPVIQVARLVGFVDALRALNVSLITSA